MPSFAKVMTIAVVCLLPVAQAASTTSCDAGDTSCESRATEETTSLLQTKAVVQHGTPAEEEHVQEVGSVSSHKRKFTKEESEDACTKQGGVHAGGTQCYCKHGDDCKDSTHMYNVRSTKCVWSPPGNDTLHSVSNKRADSDWGQWYFDHSSCTTCQCFDQFKQERELSPHAPAEQQVASLANLIYQNVGCPESAKAARAKFWTTTSGWTLASYTDTTGNHAVCKNTRDNDPDGDGYWSANRSDVNAAAHDNFALFINAKGNDGGGNGGIQPKTCVLAIEGTTFNGVKNWLNDATLVSSPWCGMNVQAGFKAEIMQFLGNWSISENEPLVGKPTWSPHYDQAQYDDDQRYPRDSIIDEFTKVVKSDCKELWVTGHSLGGAMAEMFAMCWNKRQSPQAIRKVSNVRDVPKVSKVFTFGAPSAFDPYLIPPAKNGYIHSAPAVGAVGNVAKKTTWDTCFGGKRFYNMGTDAHTEFDPVPTVATELGWMHLPYEAEQLGPANQGKHLTECSNCNLLGEKAKCTHGTGARNERKVPANCPVCQIPIVPVLSTWNTTKKAAVATATAAAAAAAVVGVVAVAPVVAGVATVGAVATVAGGAAAVAGTGVVASGHSAKVGTYIANGADMHSMGVYVERLGKEYYTSR